MAVLKFSKLWRIVDKAQMSRACRDAGVLAPRTHVTRPDENPADLAEGLSFPCLIKPNRSFATPFPADPKNVIARSPEEYGVMCFGRSEENEAVAAQALRLPSALQYRGMASLEFKHQAKDGRYYFIEMNPRLPWLLAPGKGRVRLLSWLRSVAQTLERQSE